MLFWEAIGTFVTINQFKWGSTDESVVQINTSGTCTDANPLPLFAFTSCADARLGHLQPRQDGARKKMWAKEEEGFFLHIFVKVFRTKQKPRIVLLSRDVTSL